MDYYTIYEKRKVIKNQFTEFEEVYYEDNYLCEVSSIEEVSKILKSWNLADKTVDQIKYNLFRNRNTFQSLISGVIVEVYKNLGI